MVQNYGDAIADHVAGHAENERDHDQDRENAQKILAREWGAAKSDNVKAIQRWLAQQPQPIQDAFFDGNTLDGKKVANDAIAILWLYRMATQGGSRGAPPGMDAIDRELKEIEHVMRTDRRRYNRDYSTRYVELLRLRGAR